MVTSKPDEVSSKHVYEIDSKFQRPHLPSVEILSLLLLLLYFVIESTIATNGKQIDQ